MKTKDEIILRFCFKYSSCKRCPRQQKCEEQSKKVCDHFGNSL